MQPAMEDNWLKDPWELHSIDGWLYGRGTTDNKGAVCRRGLRARSHHCLQALCLHVGGWLAQRTPFS